MAAGSPIAEKERAPSASVSSGTLLLVHELAADVTTGCVVRLLRVRTFARTSGAALFGARAETVDVQVSLEGSVEMGSPVFRIVGLPDSALREGRERIRNAVTHGGWAWPQRHVTVNLAPATSPKQGAALDLPIALAIMQAEGLLGPDSHASSWMCLGELTLDGDVRPVRGSIACAESARRAGIRMVMVPHENEREAAAVPGLSVVGVASLGDAVGHLTGTCPLEEVRVDPWTPAPPDPGVLRAVRGQPAAIRAAWIAATGGHNLLLSGPPGTGKTLLARLVAQILPPMSFEEALAASRIHSVAGLLEGGLLKRRPFRSPHHSTSTAGLVGGGRIPKPGEVSLAHNGVLFLDELPEFPRATLEALRQPIEDGRLVISRAAGQAELPADFVLVAACNPCPCGWRGVPNRCRCRDDAVDRYQRRISGPLRDRFDLHVTLAPVNVTALLCNGAEDPLPSLSGASRARTVQRHRLEPFADAPPFNARLPAHALPEAVQLSQEGERAVLRAADALGLSGRGRAPFRCVCRGPLPTWMDPSPFPASTCLRLSACDDIESCCATATLGR